MLLTKLLAALTRRPAPDPRAPRLRELLVSRGRADLVLAELRAAHAAAPLTDDLLESFVRLLLQADDRGEALEVARDAVRTRPRARASWLAQGLALQAEHRYGEALECYDRALAIDARDADVFANRGIALQNLGRHGEAAADFDRALQAAPGHALARFHASLVSLMQGDYAAGWPGYEARLISAGRATFPRYPRWSGEDPKGNAILVRGEQGLGDEIMFASCLPDLERAGARVVLECRPALRALLARSFPHATVHAAAPDRSLPAELDAVDCEVPLGSLPLYFRRQAADFPAHAGYVRADPARIAAWRARLDALGPGLKVGISWQGGTHASRAPLRSIALVHWLPILRVPGTRFVSLQYTAAAPHEVEALRSEHGIDVAHWQDAIADYDETAALVSALDLTISVCTAVVHLAGALGRPVWVMVPTNPEWRYGCAGESMPWYPSAHLHRQRRAGAWAEVIDAVTAGLRTLA